MSNNASSLLIPLLMTRPLQAAQAFVHSLPEEVGRRVAPIYSPLITIQERKVAVPIGPQDGVIFTSANAVQFAPVGAGRHAFCVGQVTTRAAQKRGWNATRCGEHADALVAYFISKTPERRLFHLSGAHTRGKIAERLRDLGYSVESLVLYDQVLCALSDEAKTQLRTSRPVLVPLFSPRTATQFAQEAPSSCDPIVVALSDAVAQAVSNAKYAKVHVAQSPTAESLIATMTVALSRM